MFGLFVAFFIFSANAYSNAHHDQKAHFLSAHSSPDAEGVGPISEVSTTMKCIIFLTIQYMAVFSALGICRSYLDFRSTPYEDSQVQKMLKSAAETTFYSPMVCLMFLGFRMRVLQLTKGTGNPQDWVRWSMLGVTYSILANTLMVMIIPLVTKKEVKTDKETGEMDLEGGNPFENRMLAIVFSVVRYACFLGLYVGFGAVCVGVFLFEPPKDVWSGDIPPVSPAVKCTMILSVTFFLVYLLVAVSRSYSQFVGGQLFTSSFEAVMLRAADTLAFAPMLSVLFLGARMRALQMDPVGGNPQPWAQNCFFACTYALICQTVLACAVPLVLGGKVSKNEKIEGDFKYELSNNGGMAAKALTVFRFLLMFTLYACTFAVVCSVFTIEHPDGKEKTPAVSPTMQCVMNLAFQYFFIYLLLWIYYTIEDLTGLDSSILAAAADAIESAKATVQFAPMLSVLFVATRMRALQITKNEGAPQGWVQDGMYLATWAVLVQFMMCLLMPLFTGKKYTADTLDGSQKTTDADINAMPGGKVGAITVTVLRYFALVALMGGTAMVITGAIIMTPETATGKGSMVPPPAGVADIPGTGTAMEGVGSTVGAGANAVNSGGEAVTGAVGDGAGAVGDAVKRGI
jgi:hypothetical protein